MGWQIITSYGMSERDGAAYLVFRFNFRKVYEIAKNEIWSS